MVNFKKLSFVMMLFIISMACIPQESYAWRWPLRRGSRPAPRRGVVKPKLKPVLAPKKHRYIKTHDLNGNGRVDIKDRLIWVGKYRAEFGTVIITEDNADLYEAMDLNNDGKLTKPELDEFYYRYDLNRNGTLEEFEIEAATD